MLRSASTDEIDLLMAAQAMYDLTVVVRIAKTNPDAKRAFMGLCNNGSPVIECTVDAEQGQFSPLPALALFLENEAGFAINPSVA